MSEHKNHVRNLAIAAMFAAMIAVSIIFLHVPVGVGILHFGDAVIYLAACILPMPYALAAAALGGGLANVLAGHAIWAPATIIIKPLIALWFTSSGKFVSARNVVALFIAGLISMSGYYLYAALVVSGSWTAPLANLGGDLVQSVGSGLMFLIVGTAFDRVGLKNRLRLGTN